MSGFARLLLPVLPLLVGLGCALGPSQQARVSERVSAEQVRELTCGPLNEEHAGLIPTASDNGCRACPPRSCAADSPFHQLSIGPNLPHRLLALEQGADALRVRLHLIRTARRSIELQTYIFGTGVSSELILEELLAAARRGVHVRVLVDQLFSLDDPRHVAFLALAHRNFELRYYNPTFREARTQAWEFAASILCCFTRLNQRMHNKLFSVDDTVAIIGGRNYRDSYFDLDPDFAYYDRELLITGPVVPEMVASFDRFWRHRVSVPMTGLHDVARQLLRGRERPAEPADVPPLVRERLAQMSRQADDPAQIRRRFIDPLRTVDSVQFMSDRPSKIRSRRPDANAVSLAIAELLSNARNQVIVQTPYLVLSRESRRLYRRHREHNPGLEVRVSTNSLAATDALPVYALSYKYKKRYLRDLGFQIYEFRPDPGDVADLIEGAEPGAAPRVSMHAKSLVVDGSISLVGTHNFDPRSDRYNTESALIIRDREFARMLSDSIERDMAPANSWMVAKRERGPAPFYRLSRLLESISTALPIFDLWPFRYASNFESIPDCPILEREHADFYSCHRDVGNFPGVDGLGKRVITRLLTAFGAPLLPIL